MVAGQVAEQHAGVDVVGEMPADIVGTSRNQAIGCWVTEWVVTLRSLDASRPPCSAIERSRLMTRQTVRYGRNHGSGKTSGYFAAIDTANNTTGTATIFHSVWRHTRIGRTESPRLLTQQSQTGPAGEVAQQLATQAGGTDRIADVERDVGLVGPELLAVVRHVHSAIGFGRREARIAEQPPSDDVVELAVGEQAGDGRPRALTNTDSACVRPINTKPIARPGPWAEAEHQPQHEGRVHVEADDADRVADRGDATQFGTELRLWATVE